MDLRRASAYTSWCGGVSFPFKKYGSTNVMTRKWTPPPAAY